MAKTKVADWIGEDQAALLLGVSRATLKRWRAMGKSPVTVYRPAGVVRYSRKGCQAYMESVATKPVTASQAAPDPQSVGS